jgi:hypothetical protein
MGVSGRDGFHGQAVESGRSRCVRRGKRGWEQCLRSAFLTKVRTHGGRGGTPPSRHGCQLALAERREFSHTFSRLNPHPLKLRVYSSPSPLGEGLVWNGWIGGASKPMRGSIRSVQRQRRPRQWESGGPVAELRAPTPLPGAGRDCEPLVR